MGCYPEVSRKVEVQQRNNNVWTNTSGYSVRKDKGKNKNGFVEIAGYYSGSDKM